MIGVLYKEMLTRVFMTQINQLNIKVFY